MRALLACGLSVVVPCPLHTCQFALCLGECRAPSVGRRGRQRAGVECYVSAPGRNALAAATLDLRKQFRNVFVGDFCARGQRACHQRPYDLKNSARRKIPMRKTFFLPCVFFVFGCLRRNRRRTKHLRCNMRESALRNFMSQFHVTT